MRKFLILFFCLVLVSCFPFGKPSQESSVPKTPLQDATGSVGFLNFFAIIGMGVSVAAFVNGSKGAVPIFIGCGVVLALGLLVPALAEHPKILAAVGFVLLGLAIVFVVKSMFIDKGLFTLKKYRKGKK